MYMGGRGIDQARKESGHVYGCYSYTSIFDIFITFLNCFDSIFFVFGFQCTEKTLGKYTP